MARRPSRLGHLAVVRETASETVRETVRETKWETAEERQWERRRGRRCETHPYVPVRHLAGGKERMPNFRGSFANPSCM
jgi:hypothetical protein